MMPKALNYRDEQAPKDPHCNDKQIAECQEGNHRPTYGYENEPAKSVHSYLSFPYLGKQGSGSSLPYVLSIGKVKLLFRGNSNLTFPMEVTDS